MTLYVSQLGIREVPSGLDADDQLSWQIGRVSEAAEHLADCISAIWNRLNEAGLIKSGTKRPGQVSRRTEACKEALGHKNAPTLIPEPELLEAIRKALGEAKGPPYD